MLFKRLREDIQAIKERDPAARSSLEILFCYPGLHAVIWYRLSHFLWRIGLKGLGRFFSYVGRMLTGVEIHPGATIGRRVFIDHATGVVIGETAEVGDDVTLYQGVTLGGTSLAKGKRHPTLKDHVIVGAGAQILGPLVIGEGARIGANAVVLQDVPAGVTMVGIPARPVARRSPSEEEEFCAYGASGRDLPDPVARALDSLRAQLGELSERLEAMEANAEGRPPEPRQRGPRLLTSHERAPLRTGSDPDV